MKRTRLILTVAVILLSTAISRAQSKKEMIHVEGNCGMCQKTIERAAKKAGAEDAAWNEDTKILTVTYDASKTTNDAIQKKVASVGYDTEKYTGDDKAYQKLDACCQYQKKSK
jgi:periplasmic mercuric ion binding protein